MAVNLINSSDIEVEQTGQDIQLKTSTPLSTITGGISDNANNIQNIINAEKYSSTEILTNKVWIDGKPIYRKVTQINVGTTEVSYPVSNDASQVWIDMGNSWCTWGGNRTYPLSRLMTEYYIDNSLNLVLKSANGTNTGYVTVEYTKTS